MSAVLSRPHRRRQHAERRQRRAAASPSSARTPRARRSRLARCGLPTTRDEDWKYANLRVAGESALRRRAGDRLRRVGARRPAAPIGGLRALRLRRRRIRAGAVGDRCDARGVAVAVDAHRRPDAAPRPSASIRRRASRCSTRRSPTTARVVHVAPRRRLRGMRRDCCSSPRPARSARRPIRALELEVEAGARVGLIETARQRRRATPTSSTAPSQVASARARRLRSLPAAAGRRACHLVRHAHRAPSPRTRSYSHASASASARCPRARPVAVALAGAGAEAAIARRRPWPTASKSHDAYRADRAHRPERRSPSRAFRGIADGRARVVFNGKIVVREHAQRHRLAAVHCAACSPARRPRSTSRPQLEIYTDDVKLQPRRHRRQARRRHAVLPARRAASSARRAQQLLNWAFLEDVVVAHRGAELRKHIERASPADERDRRPEGAAVMAADAAHAVTRRAALRRRARPRATSRSCARRCTASRSSTSTTPRRRRSRGGHRRGRALREARERQRPPRRPRAERATRPRRTKARASACARFINAAPTTRDHLHARHDRGHQPRRAELGRARASARATRSSITALEHHSNIVPWQMVCEQTGATLRVAPIDDARRARSRRVRGAADRRARSSSPSRTCRTRSARSTPVARDHRRSRTRAARSVLVDGAQAVAAPARSTCRRSTATSTRSPATRCTARPASACSTASAALLEAMPP